MAINTSRSSQCSCNTRSAFERNLNAKASSRNPKNTFTVFNQPPDLGREFIQPGKAANSPNGNANARENPNIPTKGAIPPLDAASTKRVPTMGPVHEKDTIARAKAIKKMPMIPPRSACRSTLFAQEFGSIISKAPRKETAKTIKRRKNIKLNQTLVERALSASAPKNQVTTAPRKT